FRTESASGTLGHSFTCHVMRCILAPLIRWPNSLCHYIASRLVIWGLEKIKSLSTNDVTQETVNDIILSLKGKKLKEVEQWE
ncbi:hypothetical protein KW493_21745, partial [Vibrio fluvialis]|nr:hypothetical protein [Vibrio fluvialis]MBY8130911.1 hypothetical protein [Vibrio fluvialis]